MAIVAIVPAAGLGTRLKPLSDAIPKEMLPLGQQPALARIVEELVAAGVDRVVFVLSPAKEAFIQKYFGQSARFAYAIQPEMRGLGDAVLCAEPYCSDATTLLIALGDAVFEEPEVGGLTRRLLHETACAGAEIGITVQRVPRERLSRYGVVAPVSTASETAFMVQDIVEKPDADDAPSEFAVTARYVLPDTIFDVLRKTPPAKNGEVQLTEGLRTLLASGTQGVAVPLMRGETRHDIGGFDTFYKAFTTFALQDPEYGAALREYMKETL